MNTPLSFHQLDQMADAALQLGDPGEMPASHPAAANDGKS